MLAHTSVSDTKCNPVLLRREKKHNESFEIFIIQYTDYLVHFSHGAFFIHVLQIQKPLKVITFKKGLSPIRPQYTINPDYKMLYC